MSNDAPFSFSPLSFLFAFFFFFLRFQRFHEYVWHFSAHLLYVLVITSNVPCPVANSCTYILSCFIYRCSAIILIDFFT